MSTRIHLCHSTWLMLIAGIVLFGISTISVKAEGRARRLPHAQYASLPSAHRLKDPAATGSLPGNQRPGTRTLSSFYTSVDLGSIVVRATAPTRCLPDPLRVIVADVASRFGPVSVESTHRSAGRNRRVGGVRHSLHLACRAVDLRVHGRTRGVMAYLRSRPDVGGLKMYRNGIIHIDDGSRRTW